MKFYAIAKMAKGEDGCLEPISYYYPAMEKWEDNLQQYFLFYTLDGANTIVAKLYKNFTGLHFAVLEFELSQPKILM